MNRILGHHQQHAPDEARPRRGRVGTSLIELLVTIAVGSVIAGLTATLLVSLLRTEQGGRRHALETRTLERLVRQFQVDAHGSSQLQIPPAVADPQALRPLCNLTGIDGQQIEYGQRPKEVVRRETRAGQVVRQETFRVPAVMELRVARETAGSREFVALVLGETDDAQRRGDRSPRRDWKFDAELARDSRLANLVPRDRTEEAAP